MLTEEEERHQHDEVLELISALELALLGIVAHHALSDDPSAMTDMLIATGSVIGKSRDKIKSAIERDYKGAFTLNALRAARGSDVMDWALTDAGRIAAEATREASMSLEQMLNAMKESARQGYRRALDTLNRMSNVYGYEKAAQAAVTELARNGITANSYVHKDGVVVNVPADVAARRELERSGKDRATAQVLDIAERRGVNLVDVSACPDARDSHAAWHGRRYQIKGSGEYPNFGTSCHCTSRGAPLDMVDGFGGYNCHHTIRLAYPGTKFQYQDQLDEIKYLKSIGYDRKTIQSLKSQQRVLENSIRKEKRVLETLKAEGLPTKDSNRLIKGYQADLRDLVSRNSRILKREPWRERLYDRASREMAKVS